MLYFTGINFHRHDVSDNLRGLIFAKIAKIGKIKTKAFIMVSKVISSIGVRDPMITVLSSIAQL